MHLPSTSKSTWFRERCSSIANAFACRTSFTAVVHCLSNWIALQFTIVPSFKLRTTFYWQIISSTQSSIKNAIALANSHIIRTTFNSNVRAQRCIGAKWKERHPSSVCFFAMHLSFVLCIFLLLFQLCVHTPSTPPPSPWLQRRARTNKLKAFSFHFHSFIALKCFCIQEQFSSAWPCAPVLHHYV